MEADEGEVKCSKCGFEPRAVTIHADMRWSCKDCGTINWVYGKPYVELMRKQEGK